MRFQWLSLSLSFSIGSAGSRPSRVDSLLLLSVSATLFSFFSDYYYVSRRRRRQRRRRGKTTSRSLWAFDAVQGQPVSTWASFFQSLGRQRRPLSTRMNRSTRCCCCCCYIKTFLPSVSQSPPPPRHHRGDIQYLLILILSSSSSSSSSSYKEPPFIFFAGGPSPKLNNLLPLKKNKEATTFHSRAGQVDDDNIISE